MTKGQNLNLWAECILDGQKGDFLVPFAINILLEMHTVVHLSGRKIWTTMKNPLPNHEELVSRCTFHLAYMGRGLFVELVPQQHPLIIVENTMDMDIKVIELGVITFDENETLNRVIKKVLGVALGPETKQDTGKKPDPNLVKQEPADDTDNQNMTSRADDHTGSGSNEQIDRDNNIQQDDPTQKENVD